MRERRARRPEHFPFFRWFAGRAARGVAAAIAYAWRRNRSNRSWRPVGRKLQVLEVAVGTVLHDAEIEVRASGQAGAADQADALALLDALPTANQHAREVHIHRFVPVRVS